MILYRKSTLEDLEAVWNYTIAENPGDSRYFRWKEGYISRNVNQQAVTFMAVVGGKPVGEVTLLCCRPLRKPNVSGR